MFYSQKTEIPSSVQLAIGCLFSILSSRCYSIWHYVIVIDQRSNKSRTLPFETRKNIAAIALSPDAHILLVIDEGYFVILSFGASNMCYRWSGSAAEFSASSGPAPFQL